MGLCQMVGIRRCTSDERGLFVICSIFSSYQRRFQRPLIADTRQPTKRLDGARMNSEDFVFTQKKQDSVLYSAPCASRA
jgi:hypothetical protein